MRKQIGIMVLAWYIPFFAYASELAPEIEGVLDGERHEWFILSQGSDSNASFVELGDEVRIDITGFIDGERWDAREAISISLTLVEDELIEADVVYLIGDTPLPPLYTSEDAQLTVSLTHYERDSQAVHVAGRIQGVMALQVQLDTPPSLEEGIDIDVTFDVQAQKVEF
ncbi:hypothetical protein LCGC14_0096560 [marine sediment metagenome]|uniref:Uncharacterized protein n=1 Tax=marine sediment metagenome TaxID=412755 RepID=A0A0F9VTG6_9ZZZZ|nr:hypothetical protein [Halomonas sp.]HDZ45545.1 hypothetical protein [Halomonas sp.]HEB06991.1 hypothetical protein [Halomonas sp.]